MTRTFSALPVLVGLIASLASCKKHNDSPGPRDPNTAEQASIDRFSATAGHLQVRTASNGLPAANAPVNFDSGPFITQGFAPDGKVIQYYNFDVQRTMPAPIYAFFKSDGTTAVQGQHNVIDVIPGDPEYNDFWQVYKVIVPDNYVANTVTSYQEIQSKGFKVTKTSDLVNCPVVPKGSTAAKRLPAGSDAGLTIGWYRDRVVYYFNFFERPLSVNSNGQVPVIPIYVSFNINPDQPNGGPASGFKTESGSMQTHNVITATPSDAFYSPLWAVGVYDNTRFNNVINLTTASAAPLLVPNAGDVNCPVVSIK